MIPIKLAMRIAKLAKQYGPTVLHGANVDLLTKDLGDALRRQKKVITDPDMGSLETAYEALPVVIEVKLLTLAVSRKLGVDTSSKSNIEVLEEIVKKTEANKSKSADEIKSTLDWTRGFFAHPEIQEILKSDMAEIEIPTGLGGLGKVFMQSSTRLTQEVGRIQAVIEKAKKIPEAEITPSPAPKSRKRKKEGPST